MKTKQLILSGVFVAIGTLLPTVFHLFGISGIVFLPMHIPVLLCGLVCGWKLGGLCGLIVPLLCSAFTGTPPLFHVGIAMMFELCAYGIIGGLLVRKTNVYVSLIGAMIGGRIVNGVANVLLMLVANKAYTWQMFVGGAFLTAFPGIVVQIIIIPALVFTLRAARLVPQCRKL